MIRTVGSPNTPRTVSFARKPANEYPSDRRPCRLPDLPIPHHAQLQRSSKRRKAVTRASFHDPRTRLAGRLQWRVPRCRRALPRRRAPGAARRYRVTRRHAAGDRRSRGLDRRRVRWHRPEFARRELGASTSRVRRMSGWILALNHKHLIPAHPLYRAGSG
jgi:hypothetical protein